MASSTTSDSVLEQAILALGFKNPIDFFIRFVLPILGAVVVFFFIMVFVLTGLPRYIPYVVLILGFVFVIVYPIVVFESKKTSINQNMHFFITYAGTISTRGIQRSLLFKKFAEKKEIFGEISHIARKINYFSKAWNLGYPRTCRKMAHSVPSQILSDFLDRFAIMMDLGQSLGTFIHEEQEAVMADYAVQYKQSLNSIETIQDIFVSLTMALGFMMAIGLLLPLIAGTPIDTVVKISLLALVFIDFSMLGFVKFYIPEDRITLNNNNKSKGIIRIHKIVYIVFPLSSILLIALFYLNFFPFIVNIAIGITPLMIIGVIAQKEENAVMSIDKTYPAFIRSLGSIINIKGGAVLSSVNSLRVHDFGAINELIVSVYRRLRTGNDKYKVWDLFGEESGSYLIYQFSNIFAESIYLGGDAEQIGEIVSTNFIKLLSLRRLRLQLSSGLRGALYGSIVGFSLAAYMAASLTEMLANIFSGPMGGGDMQMESILAGIAPTTALDVNPEMIALYIGLMIIIHAIVSALIIKVVDGGNYYGAFFDFVILIWIGTIISIVLPWSLTLLLPGLIGM